MFIKVVINDLDIDVNVRKTEKDLIHKWMYV